MSLSQEERKIMVEVELEHESVVYLNEQYPELKVIEADFLKLNLDEVYPEGEFSVIGNYPYNISSQIFFKVLEYKDRIPVCSGMSQKEVAERLASKPGTKAYGILSVLLQAWYDIEYLFTVDKQLSHETRLADRVFTISIKKMGNMERKYLFINIMLDLWTCSSKLISFRNRIYVYTISHFNTCNRKQWCLFIIV